MLKKLAMGLGGILMAWGLVWSLFIPNFAYLALAGMIMILATSLND